MSELLNSGNVGLTTLRTLSEQRKEIVGNWERSGLLEGLNGAKKIKHCSIIRKPSVSHVERSNA